MSTAQRPRRVPKTMVVDRTEWITRDLVRIHFRGGDLPRLDPLTQTDHYVKLLFAPAGADYTWPFDVEDLKQRLPADEWPVTRTYTIRSFDADRGELAMDFVVHGDSGLAGPWAAQAQPGDAIGFLGPGGGWRPSETADVHLLVGDESALPAIGAALDQLPGGARALVFAEVADSTVHIPLPVHPGVAVTWVHRDEAGLGYGQGLAAAVRSAPWPAGRVEAFVHGNAEMIKDLRRYLFIERGLPRDQVSISGYWRSGQNEDAWQAGKREFNRQMEEDERAPRAG